MKLDIIEAIKKRRSIRRYLDKKVEYEKVCQILYQATMAPSSGNLQNWEFIVITNEEKRKDLTIAAIKQTWMQEAPVHIVICNNQDKITNIYQRRGPLYSIQNCALAAQNLMLTATSLGLSTCFVGAFDEKAVQRILKIPNNIIPEAIITLGYGAELPRTQKRYPLETKIHFETYGSKQKNLNILPLTQKTQEIKENIKKSIFKRILKKRKKE